MLYHYIEVITLILKMHQSITECIIASCHYIVPQWMTIKYTEVLLGRKWRFFFMVIEACLLETIRKLCIRLSVPELSGAFRFPCEPLGSSFRTAHAAIAQRPCVLWTLRVFWFDRTSVLRYWRWEMPSVTRSEKGQWIQRRYWEMWEIKKGDHRMFPFLAKEETMSGGGTKAQLGPG